MKLMKRALLILAMLGVSSPVLAYHNFFFRDAGDIITGTLDNNRIDSSSVTKLGPSIGTGEIDDNSIIGRYIAEGTIKSSHTSLSLSGAIDYMIKIGTDSTFGAPDFGGTTRDVFYSAIDRIGNTGVKATVFVRRGTYTVENVVSDGVTWLCEDGAVFRRKDNNVMFRFKNGGMIGGTVIATAAANVVISTPAFIFENNSFLKGTYFQLLQTNQPNITMNVSSPAVIEISSAIVVWDNVTIASMTNFATNGTNSRNQLINVDCATFTMTNSYVAGEFLPAAVPRNSIFKVRHSKTLFQNNTFHSIGGGSIFFIDLAKGSSLYPSWHRVDSNVFHHRNNDTTVLGCITFTANSTFSVVSNNVFLPYIAGATGISVISGGFNNFAFSDYGLYIANNTMYPPDLVNKASTNMIETSGDTGQGILDMFVIGNTSRFINSTYNAGGLTFNTMLRGNRTNGTAIIDAN